jgi:hypothetical protein
MIAPEWSASDPQSRKMTMASQGDSIAWEGWLCLRRTIPPYPKPCLTDLARTMFSTTFFGQVSDW